MAPVRLRSSRRNALIDAMIGALYEGGLVNRYFDGKEALLETTMRRLARDLASRLAAAA